MAKLILLTVIILAANASRLAQEPLRPNAQKPTAIKILEVGKARESLFSKNVINLLSTLDKKKWTGWSTEVEMVILTFGDEAEMNKRVTLIRDAFEKADFHHFASVTYVWGGRCESIKTVFWEVPRGAELPTVCPREPESHLSVNNSSIRTSS